MRKLRVLLAFFSAFFFGTANAAEMVNVEYIHKLIEQQWGVTVPYNPALENPKVAANMKYLLTAVDATNKILNDCPTTNYGNSVYATMYEADTIATNEAVRRLIKKDVKFVITTTPDTDSFSFYITSNASNDLIVYWGDGTKHIGYSSVAGDAPSGVVCGRYIYSHTYDRPGTYKIGLAGFNNDTGASKEYCRYNTTAMEKKYAWPAISFEGNENIAGISGSLGEMFPTIENGDKAQLQPKFNRTFYGCKNLAGPIPENLFDGVFGSMRSGMFKETFANCPNLTGPSARINGKYLYEKWPSATTTYVGGCYNGATGLSDYDNIPNAWK